MKRFMRRVSIGMMAAGLTAGCAGERPHFEAAPVTYASTKPAAWMIELATAAGQTLETSSRVDSKVAVAVPRDQAAFCTNLEAPLPLTVEVSRPALGRYTILYAQITGANKSITPANGVDIATAAQLIDVACAASAVGTEPGNLVLP